VSRFLLILDNGQDYSDNQHEPIVCCDSEKEAQEALSFWNLWLSDFKKAFDLAEDGSGYFDSDEWIVKNPSPSRLSNDWTYCAVPRRWKVSIMPVPAWAEPI
jgi:hypothetical protein